MEYALVLCRFYVSLYPKMIKAICGYGVAGESKNDTHFNC